ncbi:MAG: dihydroorotase [Candidatus Bilamarchaeaceae archaeon]
MLVIKNGKVFFNGQFQELDIALEFGRIVKIARSINGEESYDAAGALVLPGLIDPHVHLREPGATYKEDFRTGTMAAVAGGFTTVIDMPNNPTPTTTAARLREKQELASKKALCDVLFHFGATDNNFEEVKKAKPISMKIYLGKTTGELYLRDHASLERHFQNYSGQFVFHADASEGSEEMQFAATCANIETIGHLSKRYGRRAHIAHASSGMIVDLSNNLGLTVEVAPHYLFLSKKDAERLGHLGTVYPNLRSEQHRKTLWGNIQRVHCIATDHAPHTIEDKKAGAHGFPGLETSLALMLQAYWERVLSLEWIVERMSSSPAGIFALESVGKLAEGFWGNIAILDLKKEWVVKGEELYTKCKWSPFERKMLKGKIRSVFYKGNLIFDDFSFIL